MAGLKIVRRSTQVWSVIFYVNLTFMFYFIVNVLAKYQTALDVSYFQDFFYQNLPLSLLNIGLSLAIYFFSKLTQYIYLFVHTFIFYQISHLLFFDFNKLIFLSSFIFFIFSYFYYLQIKSIRKKAFYNPNIGPESLDLRPLFEVKVKVQETGQTEWFRGIFTNWDKEGAFILLEDKVNLKKRFLNCTIFFNNHEFVSLGKVYSRYPNIGLGIAFKSKKGTFKNWNQLYQVLSDYGHSMSNLK